MNIRWKLAAAGGAVVVLGLLTLRFGGAVIGPFLGPGRAVPDSQAVADARPSDSASVSQQSSDTGSVTRFGPFVIDGRSYTFQVERDTGAQKPREAARRVQGFDSTGRVVYDENLFLRRDSTGSEDWLQFTPILIEDASGLPRGFKFSYEWYPTAPSSGEVFDLVAPHGDSLVVLTPSDVGYYGSLGALQPGATPGSLKLDPGNRIVIESGRGWFDAFINLRVNLGCVPKSADCLRLDLPDSIAGLARFAVRPSPRQSADTMVAVDVYSAPHGSSVDRIAIPPGQQAEILGGAGKIYFDRTPALYLSADDEWLEIKINGKRGWITGPEAFRAIGLQQVG
jgi:hypothetical protein